MDDVMKGFVRLKSLLIEAQERFGEETGIRVMALAQTTRKHAAKQDPTVTLEDCYRYLCELADGDPRAWQAILEVQS